MGWAFDAFSVLISLTDVVSDVLVAIQFWQDGHHLWAWLVYGCFINSNLVYSVMIVLFAIKYPNSTIDSQRIPQWFRDLPFVLLVVIVFPFAQLAPSGNYILQTFFVKHDSDDEGDYGSPAKPDVSGKTSRVGRLVEDENAAIRHDEATVGRLLKAVKKQVHTHGMLFAETIVESIPQSIVQLLAITFLGNPTTLQVVSMVLSVMSVVTKGYFVALSCSTKIVISKFFIVAFDLLSMFYIFSSVLAEDRPREVAVFGSSLEVSMLSYVWLIKLCVGVAMSALFTLIGGVSLILGKSRETLGQYLLVATIAVLGQIPALLAFEAAKLSWIIGLVFPIEPHGSGLEASTVTFSFLRHAKDRSEWAVRFHHLAMAKVKDASLAYTDKASPVIPIALLACTYDDCVLVRRRMKQLSEKWRREPKNSVNGEKMELFSGLLLPSGNPYQSATTLDGEREAFLLENKCFFSNGDSVRASAALPAYTAYSHRRMGPFSQFVYAVLDREVWKFCNSGGNGSDGNGRSIVHARREELHRMNLIFQSKPSVEEIDWFIDRDDVATADEEAELLHERLQRILSIWRCAMINVEYLTVGRFSNEYMQWPDKVCFMLSMIWGVVAFLGSFVSLAYPFVDASLNFATLNLLQRVFLYGCIGCLSIVICTIPTWTEYIPFLLAQSGMRWWLSMDADDAKRIVASYHIPSAAHVLLKEVPRHLVPRDVIVNVLAPLLEMTDGIDTSNLSVAQCEEYRSQL